MNSRAIKVVGLALVLVLATLASPTAGPPQNATL